MRVKAGPKARKGWFANGEYTVLGLVVRPSGEIRFIIEESPDSPGLHSPGEVVITDGRLPPSWRASIESDGSLDLEPSEWTAAFWEAFENGDAAAWETYRRVKARLETESR